MRGKLFSHMAIAPRDGTLIEVRHVPNQEIVLARWSGQAQAFVRDDDPDHKILHRVTAWRPAPEGQGRLVTAAEPVEDRAPRVEPRPTMKRILKPRKARAKPEIVAPVVVREEAKDRAMNATDRTPEELIAKFCKVSRAKPGNTIYEDGVFGISYPLTGSAADRLTPAKLRQIINRERRKAKRRHDSDDTLSGGLT